MNKKIKALEEELEKMKEYHKSLWYDYGSELCGGDMIRQEEELEKKIEKLREEGIKKEDPKYIIDD